MDIEPWCSKCCNTCYETCCLQNGLCSCAPGKYRENGVCTQCPSNSNSVLGSVGASSCICNAGFSGPPGGPCTLILYPTTVPRGCAAGYWAPSNQCQSNDYNVVNHYFCYNYAKLYVGTGGNKHVFCLHDSACTKCCEQCASFSGCSTLTPQPCTACPANSHSPFGSTSQSACSCNAGYSGPAGGTCVLASKTSSTTPEATTTPEPTTTSTTIELTTTTTTPEPTTSSTTSKGRIHSLSDGLNVTSGLKSSSKETFGKVRQILVVLIVFSLMTILNCFTQ